jgi:hypothetical protein
MRVTIHHTTFMRALTLTLTAVLAFHLHSALAASPEEEARFVAAAKQAFEKHDANALVLLTCWDRVPDRIKKEGVRQYERAVATTNALVTLENPGQRIVRLNDGWTKNMDPRFAGFGRNWEEFSVTNHLNLPAIKELKMVYGPIKNSDGSSTTIDWSYPVGEKDGKLCFCEPAPVK